MHNAVEVFAPFLSSHDAEQIIDNVNRMPVWQRWPKARVLGESRAKQHETLQLRGIHPCDISDEDLAERRKARKRAREQQRRKGKGAKPRSAYLASFANSINKTKPWVQLGMSKASYYRKKKT